MHICYTAGYQGLEIGALAKKAEALKALVIDVRMSPSARDPQWRKDAMVAVLGRTYRHAVEFGNVNFRGGPIQLKDPNRGLSKIGPILYEQPVILLCACWNVSICHRRVVANLISGEYGCEIVHLGKGDFPKKPPTPPAQTSLF